MTGLAAEDKLMLRRARRWLHRVTTGTDVGRLTIWASTALAAGALPALLLGGSTLLGLPQHSLLLAGFVIAGGLAGIYAVENLRRRGTAVFVHLPGRGDTDSPRTELRKFADIVLDKHRAWFRTGPEPAEERLNDAADRVRWTFTTIEHRLTENRINGFAREPLFLYLQCRQEEAVELGRLLHPQIINQSADDILSAHTSLEVRYVSEFLDYPVVHRINILQSLQSSYSVADTSICDIDEFELSAAATHTSRPARVALIIRAGHKSQEAPQEFIDTARRAAAGDTTTRYHVTETDPCSWALVVKIDVAQLIVHLQDGIGHMIVAEIRDSYRNLCREKFGRDAVPVRLLSDGPTTLLMALAAVIGDVRLIRWKEAKTAATTKTVLFALIDGDDVGARMEQLLLNDERL